MLYLRQSRMVRRLEDDWFGGSPPILRVAPVVNRYLRLGRRPLSEGQVTTTLLTPAVGSVHRPSLSVPAGAFQTTTENERARPQNLARARGRAQNGA